MALQFQTADEIKSITADVQYMSNTHIVLVCGNTETPSSWQMSASLTVCVEGVEQNCLKFLSDTTSGPGKT